MPQNPFLLNVSDLLGRDSSGRSVQVEANVDWKLELISVSTTEPIVADLMLHPVSGGIAVTGRVNFVTDDTCSKCLRTTATERTAAIGALFDGTPDDETYDLDGHDIDTEQMLRDEVLLSLPVVTICGEDCPGVVDSAQNDLNTDFPDDEGDSRSPFAGLRDLLEPGD
jgi:uncharacterized protein